MGRFKDGPPHAHGPTQAMWQPRVSGAGVGGGRPGDKEQEDPVAHLEASLHTCTMPNIKAAHCSGVPTITFPPPV